MDTRRSASRVLIGVLGTVAVVALAAASPRVLPYNMDEFVHYHALGCATAPLGQGVPSFRDGCGLYDLRLPFTQTWLPLRSYYYIGSAPSAVFLPFWLLLADPVGTRLQGALFFVAFVFLAARLLRVGSARILLAAVVFPFFTVAFLADQGPVGLSALLLLGALLAGRRALESPSARGATAWAAAAGFTVFVGLWVKPVFAWWLPGAVFFVVAEARRHDGTGLAALRRLRPALLAGALAVLVPSAVLFSSVDLAGRPYGAAVSRGRLSVGPAHVGAGASRLLPYFGDASFLAPRNVSLPPSRLDGLAAVAGVLILVTGLFRRRPRRGEIAGWAILGLAAFGLAATSAFTRWPHHVFFPAVFVVFSLALALDVGDRRIRFVAAVLVAVLWASLALRWPGATYPRNASPAKDELLAFVRDRGLDRDTFQVHASWGTYYIAQLFGDPERIAVFVRGISDDAVQLREVSCLAQERGRRLLLISSRRWERLQTETVDDILGRPDQTWRFGDWWAVAYDTDGVTGCQT